MSRTITKVRVVKTIDRLLGSGIQESFWTVQVKTAFKWKDAGIFADADAAYREAIKRASV